MAIVAPYVDKDIENIKSAPYSTEAEQSVLGGVLLDNTAIDSVMSIVTSEDFYHPGHRIIFEAIVSLMSNSRVSDPLTLGEFLEGHEKAELTGGLGYFLELVESVPSVANICAYAEIVKEKSIQRQLIATSQIIATSAYNPGGKPVRTLLEEAERSIFKIAENSPNEGGLLGVREVLEKAVHRIDELFHAGDSITGVATGFKDLDQMTSGMQKSDMVIVAARPSMGKTTFAMNLVENALDKINECVLVFSLEMSAEQLMMRMLSSLGRINQSNVRSGRLNETDWPKILSAVERLKDKQLYIDDTAGISPQEMRSRARRLIREQGPLGLIVIDYLQLMQIPGYREGRTNEISEISRSLKGMAKEFNVPVVALSQLNRSLEQRPNKRPVNSDLRESGAIEQDADLIMFIYRDEVYNPDTEFKGVAEVIIGKQRNGPIGSVKLAFLGAFTRFDNLAAEVFSDASH